MKKRFNRRRFLRQASGLVGTVYVASAAGRTAGFLRANGRPRLGVVGCGSRWGWQLANGGRYGVGPAFARFGDYVAACDVDRRRLEAAQDLIQKWNGQKPAGTPDYREVIDRDDVDVVVVFTPDHWHAKVAIEAMLAGKDVYCEKPMTLTIQEGQQICDVQRRTGRVFQVGSQQRSDRRFITAIAMIRDGRIGDVRRVECGIGGAPTSPEIPAGAPPAELDWNRWLGPAPRVEYRALEGANNETKTWSRCHYEFRWWYEYSGGKLTDWGAHHVDIATWGMGKTETGPVTVDPVLVEHPVPFRDGFPTRDDQYNTATRFHIKASYADGMQLDIRHDSRNGVLFEGTLGRIFVSRGTLTGKPVDDLQSNPLKDGALEAVYKQQTRIDSSDSSIAHVQNFFESVKQRREPISDVQSHHRALTTCHLAGIACRLGRRITWDPVREQVVDDVQAQSLVAREKRPGFEIQT